MSLQSIKSKKENYEKAKVFFLKFWNHVKADISEFTYDESDGRYKFTFLDWNYYLVFEFFYDNGNPYSTISSYVEPRYYDDLPKYVKSKTLYVDMIGNYGKAYNQLYWNIDDADDRKLCFEYFFS